MSIRILQLGAGPLMIHSIRMIQQIGYEVFAVDKNPDSPAFSIANGYAAIDIVDSEKVKEYANNIGASAVLAVNDAGIYTATLINRLLGLKGNNPEDVILFTDKGYMRERWKENELPQPEFRVVTSVSKIREAIEEMGLPVILKPCFNWGSRGISLVKQQSDIDWAIGFAKENCKNDRFIVERFISGTEMTVEGLVQNGKVTILAKSDKIAQQHDKFRVAMQLNYPAAFSEDKLRQADAVIEKAALSLGIVNGAIHAECMVNNDGIFLIELAGRPGGGHIFGLIVKAVSGVYMPQALTDILLNKPTNLQPKFQKGACYKFFSPPPGRFDSVEHLEEAKALHGILDMGFSFKSGSIVGAIAGDPDRPGFIVAEGHDRDNAIKNADAAFKLLNFNMVNL